ncbi:hypothetical protein BBO_09385 [Beauveria brongniartii RCEF 3172]|uniref:Heat-labile enterotoxin IIA, A chain n=1 Tax=Beauveria brongniartii RCEF 3172 TaxID=1081107 RepID=A0A166VRL1_9HYPO|nr:hypothetical protein BBO_09385 [Beauveria brongniartii RCEF 3172]
MRVPSLFTITLIGVFTVGTIVSAAGLPPTSNSSNGNMLDKRLTAADLPAVTGEEVGEITKLYDLYKSGKKIKDFNNVVSKAKPGKALETLAKKLGGGLTASKVRSSLEKFPSQPQTVVFSFLIGIGECLLQGKTITQAVECGKASVRALGDNATIQVPKTCNNRLGQLELFGTGWPAPCHDPSDVQHPQGNAAHRGIKWALCKSLSVGEPQHPGGGPRRGPSCDERFPTDKQIKDELCRKYFGGAPCGGTVPLNNEEDFKRVIAQRKKFLAALDPRLAYESTLEVQTELPALFTGPNASPLGGETCYGGKCSQVCSRGECTPVREVCEPECKPDRGTDGQCMCGWDRFREECITCHVKNCGQCTGRTIIKEGGSFLTQHERQILHVECKPRQGNNECFFVPTQPAQ